MKTDLQKDNLTMADEELVSRFFSENVPSNNVSDIPDNGFSLRVSQAIAGLPPSGSTRMITLNRVWSCLCAAVVIVYLVKVDITGQLRLAVQTVMTELSLFSGSFPPSASTLLTLVLGILIMFNVVVFNVVAESRRAI